MIKTTLKEIKLQFAVDITNWKSEELKQLKNNLGDYKIEAYSVGIYGCNGELIYSSTLDRYYKVTARTAALFIF